MTKYHQPEINIELEEWQYKKPNEVEQNALNQHDQQHNAMFPERKSKHERVTSTVLTITGLKTCEFSFDISTAPGAIP